MPSFADELVPFATSIATPIVHQDEVTVRFRKWHAFAKTAYQKGEFAGFLSEPAKALVRQGVADIVDPATGAILQVDLTPAPIERDYPAPVEFRKPASIDDSAWGTPPDVRVWKTAL